MKRSTIYNLIIVGGFLPWDCVGGETGIERTNRRRRARFVRPTIEEAREKSEALAALILGDQDFSFRADFSDREDDVDGDDGKGKGSKSSKSSKSKGKGSKGSKSPKSSKSAKSSDYEVKGSKSKGKGSKGSKGSKGDLPKPRNRDTLIQEKCGLTALERSRDILTVLLQISDTQSLTNPEASQFKARDWVDNIDEAIICADNKARIEQRYRLALLYYELGGSQWTRCKAATDVIAKHKDKGCPGTRFLDKADECEWYGVDCGDSYNVATAEWMDAYYPIESLDLQSNNLQGELYDEFYGFTSLKELRFNDNSLSGTIGDEIGQLTDLTVLQLDSNNFEGPVPRTGLLKLTQLSTLTLQENALTGSLYDLCDALDYRRMQFEDYLEVLEADCHGKPPEVTCDCCTQCF